MRLQANIDFSLTDLTEKQATAEMPLTNGIRNPFGVASGGAILWFAEVTATVLVFGRRDFSEGLTGFPVAVSLNANFLGNQPDGVLRAVSTFVKKGKTISVVRTVVTGSEGKLVADVTTTHTLPR